MSVIIPIGEEGGQSLPPVLVKELLRRGRDAALYQLRYPDGHHVWRICKPVKTPSEVPTSLWPEFQNEDQAWRAFTGLLPKNQDNQPTNPTNL